MKKRAVVLCYESLLVLTVVLKRVLFACHFVTFVDVVASAVCGSTARCMLFTEVSDNDDGAPPCLINLNSCHASARKGYLFSKRHRSAVGVNSTNAQGGRRFRMEVAHVLEV